MSISLVSHLRTDQRKGVDSILNVFLVHLEKSERHHTQQMKSAHCFFINLFRNFGPQAYEPWKKWVEQWVTHRESRYQRVAIALWGAALVCHNHWPANEAFKIQKWAVQILDSAIPHISANIKPFWEKMFELAANRDIRYYSGWEFIPVHFNHLELTQN